MSTTITPDCRSLFCGLTRFALPTIVACFITTEIGAVNSVGATECRPGSLGVERVIAVDPKEHTKVGTMQYGETLPLTDHEVVITFDDGPSPKYTDQILAALDAECVKATFFMVGEMAKTFPAEARKVKAAGHTVGTHSFSHPFTFEKMTEAQAGREVDKGIDAISKALGSTGEVAPFFRVPGFLTSKATEQALASRGLMTWSADVPADDWKPIDSNEVVQRAMSRLEAKGRGILLLHDIHQRTVAALPAILSRLKLNGFKVVQIVPSSATAPKTSTTPDQWKLPQTTAPLASQQKPFANQSETSENGRKMSASESHRSRASKLAAIKGNSRQRAKRNHLVVRHHSISSTQAPIPERT